jgi:hypothetical protein
MGDELAAGGMPHGGGDAHLDAELVGPVCLALADALDLWRVQGIDLATALAALLFKHAPGEIQRPHERFPQNLNPGNVPLDVANDPAEIGLELAQAPVGAFELMGMGVTLVRDQCQLADPSIGLAQAHAELLSQAHQPLARPVQQLGVGREHHRLRLHRGVDHNTGEVGRLHCFRPGRHRQALLQQRLKLLFPHPLAPTRQR